jgi:hypothetical protein
MKDLLKNDIFKDTTSSIKDVVKTGAKGAAMYAKFQTIIGLIVSIVIYSVIIWLSFTYIINVDYIKLEGTVITSDCEDKPYTTTTKDSKSGNESTTTGTTTTCKTTFNVTIPDAVKAQGLLVMKYINTNNMNTNNSLRSLNNINTDGTTPVVIQNTIKYTPGDKIPLYFVDEKPLNTTNAYLTYIPKSVGYVIISLILVTLLSHILWTYLVFTNDTLATVVGTVEIYDVLT